MAHTELLDRQGRRHVLNDAYEIVRSLEGDFVYETKIRQRYLGMLSIVGVRQSDELSKGKDVHTSKMLALEGHNSPRLIEKPSDIKFWDLVESEAGDYWVPAKSFPGNLSRVPQDWLGARNDLFTLRNFVASRFES